MIRLFKQKPKKVFKVNGMHCASCAMVIESDLEDIGIQAKCSYAKQTVEVSEGETSREKEIRDVVKKAGYTIVE